MQGIAFKTTYTLAEAADLLSCHKETLRRAIHSGELRAAKVGKGFRLSRIDLETYWTASGGGDLFPKLPEADTTVLQEIEKEPLPLEKEDDGPVQLSLFTVVNKK